MKTGGRDAGLDHRAGDVRAADLGAAAVFDDGPIAGKVHEIEHVAGVGAFAR